MTTRNLLLAGAGGLLIAALSATAVLAMNQKPAAPEPAKAVDADKLFNGRWAEIGRTPMKLTDGCVAGATTYTKISPTRVDVRDTCQDKTPTGKEKAIGGPGKILDPGTNTKLHVSYRVLGVIPLGRDYWILDHADDYSWFISADPAFKNLWIYARDPRIGRPEIDRLVAKARAMGYDTTKLEFPAQP
jgi:apolipoprotein D and lipocalin family protein